MFNVIDKTDRGQAVFGETGMVVAVSEAVTVACACDLDISHFPFDSQCCKINLAQWFASSSLSKAYRLGQNIQLLVKFSFRNKIRQLLRLFLRHVGVKYCDS